MSLRKEVLFERDGGFSCNFMLFEFVENLTFQSTNRISKIKGIRDSDMWPGQGYLNFF